MEYEIQLFDAVEGSRLQLVSDLRISELTAAQQSKLLLVKYGVDISDEESIVTVNFIDYLTGRPVASCRGAYTSLGFSVSAGKHSIASEAFCMNQISFALQNIKIRLWQAVKISKGYWNFITRSPRQVVFR